MSHKIPLPSKETLEELYSKPGVSISKLAKTFNTSNPTVRSWLKKYKIDIKSHKMISSEVNRLNRKGIPDKSEFSKLYKTYSIKELEKHYGVSQATIYDWINFLNIDVIDFSKRVSNGKIKKFENKIPKKDHIHNTYKETKSISKTASIIGVSSSYLKKYMKDKDIETIKSWSSKKEIEIYEYLSSNDSYGEWESCNRSLISPFELDIISHKRKIAIEYCGLYWHSEYNGNKNKNYHINKLKMCEEKGYRLITIFESDDEDKVYSYLNHIIGKNSAIYARNTEFREVNTQESRTFNDLHHMHGDHSGKIKVGLFYENELVLNASFSKSRYDKSYDLECIRMTSHKDFRIIGGVSKIFKNILNEYDKKSIITYVDLRYGNGNSYEKSNLIFSHRTPPNYWYFIPSQGVLHSRIQFQKHKLKDKLCFFDKNLTEWENMKNNGWDRIWDCGNATYSYK